MNIGRIVIVRRKFFIDKFRINMLGMVCSCFFLYMVNIIKKFLRVVKIRIRDVNLILKIICVVVLYFNGGKIFFNFNGFVVLFMVIGMFVYEVYMCIFD